MGVYVIQDTRNGKCYVGSSKDVFWRWRHYTVEMEGGVLGNWKLRKAFETSSGITDWRFGVLEWVDSKDRLEECEGAWVKKLNSYEQGYNCTPDGKYPQRIVHQAPDIPQQPYVIKPLAPSAAQVRLSHPVTTSPAHINPDFKLPTPQAVIDRRTQESNAAFPGMRDLQPPSPPPKTLVSYGHEVFKPRPDPPASRRHEERTASRPYQSPPEDDMHHEWIRPSPHGNKLAAFGRTVRTALIIVILFAAMSIAWSFSQRGVIFEPRSKPPMSLGGPT